MDCNSIIYDAVHTLEKSKLDPSVDFEDAVIESVIKKIDEYVRMIKPTTTIFIAFDGVAPFAKMDQQRKRRYKSNFMSTIGMGGNSVWNTCAITPGTVFMDKLSSRIDASFKNTEAKYKVANVVVSCANEPGEGEHKLYHHIRSNSFQDDTIAVYGLDSDLIMLSIFHLKYCENIYIFREAPEFIKSSIPLQVRGKENEPHFLNIKQLSGSISIEMGCKYEDKSHTIDYVFLCFLLGNDFLPHFPAMNIRTHGISVLLDIYKKTIGIHDDVHLISKTTGKIEWKNVEKLILEISKREHDLLLNEHFVRDKFEKRTHRETTTEEKEEVLQNVPTIYRAEEKFICPTEHYWENRYYNVLFHCDRSHAKNICMNYLEGLEWVYTYYTSGCVNHRWKYNYNYAPLFVDLVKYMEEIDKKNIEVRTPKNPFTPTAQLIYVLPANNHSLLSSEIAEKLQQTYSHLYPKTYTHSWAYARYLWEAHPILPDISIEILSSF